MTIREYIDSQDESIRPRLNAVYDTIRAAIPEAEERLSWGMPTFWKGSQHHPLRPGEETHRAVSRRGSGGAFRAGSDRIQDQQGRDPAPQRPRAALGADRRDRPLELGGEQKMSNLEYECDAALCEEPEAASP